MDERGKFLGIGPLMIIVFSAVLLWALVTVVWSVPVVYAADPEILTITVTSSMGTYFYDPGLDPTGGTVYFNSLGGEGAGQVLTVTVVCSGTVTTFEGTPAFDDTPSPDTSGPPWQVTYTVEAGAGTQSGVVLTVTNAMSQTDTAAITFTQDNADPDITSPAIVEGSDYLYADGLTVYYGDDMGMASQAFTVQGNAQDNGAGLHRVVYSPALKQLPPPYEDYVNLASWHRDYTANQSDTTSGVITATIYDRVGNFANQTFTYIRDINNPTIDGPFIAEDSDYLHASGTTIYYSDQMGSTPQSFTVQGNAADPDGGAGLFQATFSSAFGSSPGDDPDPGEWSGTYNHVESGDSGDGTITVRVYDNVDNWSEQTFNYEEDTTPPTVELTDVTDPGHDENTNELDNNGSNWYSDDDFTAGGDGWQFTSNTSDGGAGRASGSASWDHSTDQTDRTLDCGVEGDGTFSSVSGDADGTVTVTVVITDNVGNSASDDVGFNIDNTEPTITSPSIDDYGSPWLHVDDLTIYYGDDMSSPQTFRVQGQSADGGGVGLGSVDFSAALGDDPYNQGTLSDWWGEYSATSSNTDSGTIIVTVYDLLGNAADQSFNYTRDTEPPIVDVNCPALTSEPSFLVSWSDSSDPPPNASGLRHFDVQYKVTEFGDWQDWHTDTILIEDTFGPLLPIPVQDNTTYYFRVRAEDNVGNEQQYTNGEDATTYHSGIERVYLPLIISPDPNWGFEKGDFSGWQHGGELAQSVSTAMPRFGSYSALLGDPGYSCVDGVPVGSAWLSRSVMVPSSGSPTLSFWYRMYTQDKNSALSDQYDLFVVYINGSQVVVKDANTTVQQSCGSPNDLGWKQVIFPLSAYKGQFIEITFYNYNRAPVGPKWYNTYTYVDDVSVQ